MRDPNCPRVGRHNLAEFIFPRVKASHKKMDFERSTQARSWIFDEQSLAECRREAVAFQGEAILRQPLVIALLAVPILIQVLFNSALAYWLNRAVGEKHNIACPSALIGASNFFELAVAAAISLFGFNSGAALATVVGVLIEVPVMLLVVYVVNNSKSWYNHEAIV